MVKICPLLSMRGSTKSAMTSCLEEQCGFYDHIEERCGIAVISMAIMEPIRKEEG